MQKKRITLAGGVAMLCLSGCHLPPDNTAPARKYGAASEVAVTRHAQYQLWEQGTYSAALPSRQPGGSLQAHSGRVSFDWEGDALELGPSARTTVQLQRRASSPARLTPCTRYDLR